MLFSKSSLKTMAERQGSLQSNDNRVPDAGQNKHQTRTRSEPRLPLTHMIHSLLSGTSPTLTSRHISIPAYIRLFSFRSSLPFVSIRSFKRWLTTSCLQRAKKNKMRHLSSAYSSPPAPGVRRGKGREETGRRSEIKACQNVCQEL